MPLFRSRPNALRACSRRAPFGLHGRAGRTPQPPASTPEPPASSAYYAAEEPFTDPAELRTMAMTLVDKSLDDVACIAITL